MNAGTVVAAFEVFGGAKNGDAESAANANTRTSITSHNSFLKLDATFFARAATIVRHRRAILDDADFQADGLKGADGRFTARAGTLNADFNFTHAVRHSLPGGILGD